MTGSQVLSKADLVRLRTLQGQGFISAVGEYTPEEFWALLDLADDLEAARKAWRQKVEAEHQLARLRGYARLTPGMKDDQRRWSRQLHEATTTLARILGGGA